MNLKTLSVALIASGLMLGCNDKGGSSGGSSGTEPPSSVAGVVRLDSGEPLSDLTITLFDSDNNAIATTRSDAEGHYQFPVSDMSYRLRADAVLDNGAALSQGMTFNLAAPQSDTLPPIIFPDLNSAALVVTNGRAQGEGISVTSIPDSLSQLWAAGFRADDLSAFPGVATTASDPFTSGGYWWFGATDSTGQRLSQFNPPLSITVDVNPHNLRQYYDATPGNDQIDVAMTSFNADTGLWQNEASGILVDKNGEVIPESALSAIQSGSYDKVVRLAFSAPHFSAYSAALFYRIGLPDFNDANAGLEQKHLRPEVAFNTGNNYFDFWLGDSVAGESQPRQGDSSDDGLRSCGTSSWVKVSYKVVPGTNPRTVYLQVFQKSGPLEDIDGEAPGTDYTVRFDSGDWVGKNIPVENWSASFGPIRYAYLKLEDYLGAGHGQGYLRLQLTGSPLLTGQVGVAMVHEGGEVEDYLDSCAYILGVEVSGQPDDSVTAKALQCSSDDENCSLRIGSAETVTFSAFRDGQSIAVDWSVPSDLVSVEPCNSTPTCSVRREDNGTISLTNKSQLRASFPYPANVVASYISGFGAVRDSSTQIDCDARSHEDRPDREACSGEFNGGSTVVLHAEAADGWEFSSWYPINCLEGDQLSKQCSFKVVDNAHYYQQAYFSPSPTLSVSNSGGGEVVSAPSGIACFGSGNNDDQCQRRFPRGSSVTLRAQPSQGMAFHSWTGPCADQQYGECTLTIDEDVNVGVNFGASAPLTINIDGEGSVTSQPEGIDCSHKGGSCHQDFLLGQSLKLSATPTAGFAFTSWSAPCTEADTSCSLNHNQAREITARFSPLYTLEVSVENPGGQVNGTGSISGCEQNGDGTNACQDTYSRGSEVTLVAEAHEGFEFVRWGGDCSFAAGDSQCRFTINADSQVTASFQPIARAYTLILRVEGRSGTSGDYEERLICDNDRSPCSQTYTSGSMVSLFAVPDTSSDIVRWSVACNGSADNDDCHLTIDQHHEAIVTFIEKNSSDMATLTVNLSGSGEGMVSDGQFSMDCSSGPCSASYPIGSTVTLRATPMTTDDEFSGWAAPAHCSGTTGNCTITLNEDTNATAEFNKL